MEVTLDRTKLWESVDFIMFNAERKKDAEHEIPDIVKLLKVNKNEKVLDLCCGVGRHTLHLARLGFKTTGVDLTQKFLNNIKKIATDENLSIDLVHSNMVDFRRENEFDVILNLWDSFGMNPIEEDFKCLQNVYTSLKDGGRFLMELTPVEVTAKRFVPRKWYEEDGMYILKDRIPDKDLRGLMLRWIVIKGAEKYEFEKYVYQYTSHELTDMLKKVGYRNIDLYENFKGDPYSYTSNNLVLVAYK